MSADVTIKIGGEAGQGIQTVGQLLALCCREAGLWAFGINDFESRIRGGHNFFQIRIADQPVHAPSNRVHILIALDQNTPAPHGDEVLQDGVIVCSQQNDVPSGVKAVAVDFDGLAKQSGSPLAVSTIAAAAALALLGAPLELFTAALDKQFEEKSSETLAINTRAAQLGYAAVAELRLPVQLPWNNADRGWMCVEGAQALALGALAGDCRFAAFYPMSPATGIMLHLTALQDDFPMVVEQVEDEIAAVNMIIGAAYAGARSITATSGGGFALMAEGLGYAGIAEIPIVIIDAQRPGPATGLATRTGQGDLQFVLHAGQDDFPRLVLAPGSPRQAYEAVARACVLAEKYQVPAIVLTDQYFNDSLYVLQQRFAAPERVERFLMENDHPQQGPYQRYAQADSGVSPMRVPGGAGPQLVRTTGNEHSADGHISEHPHDRTGMVDKRARKLAGLLAELRPPEPYHGAAQTLLIGWGSTAGCLRETVDMLRARGVDAGCLHFCDLWPFPARAAMDALSGAQRIFSVELNSTGQFARLLRQETGIMVSGTVLKYDGRPFYPVEIYETVLQAAR